MRELVVKAEKEAKEMGTGVGVKTRRTSIRSSTGDEIKVESGTKIIHSGRVTVEAILPPPSVEIKKSSIQPPTPSSIRTTKSPTQTIHTDSIQTNTLGIQTPLPSSVEIKNPPHDIQKRETTERPVEIQPLPTSQPQPVKEEAVEQNMLWFLAKLATEGI